jgi:DNA-binding transcriptional ArsR family regulator
MSRKSHWDIVFKALSHPVRRKILDALKKKPMTTGALCGRFRSLDRCTVMLHMNVLESAGLILAKRDGRLRWNYLNVAPIKDIFDRWISGYAAPSVDLLMRLKRDLETRTADVTSTKT